MIKVDGTINGGTISNNKTMVNDGGGIRVDGMLTVNSGNIINNSSNRNGGGIDWTYGVVFWNNGKMENNSANEEGNNLYPEFSDESNNWVNFERLNIIPIDVALGKKYNKKTDISDINLQGMTVTDKYLVFAQMKTEDENAKINIVDKNTYKILNTIDDYCFGHANNIAYNSKDGKCYMSYTKDNKSYVTSFKINDNQQLEDLKTKQLDKTYFALTYDEDDNCFIGISGDEIFIIDENFDNIIRKFKYSEKDLTKQDIMYYKGHIYFACWEAGKKTVYQTNFNNREKNSNVIYVYNMEGTLKKTLYISNKKAFGEIEGVAVDSNGKLILGYNTESWTSISFYSSNYLNGVDSVKISSLPLKNKYIQNYEKLDLTGGELTVNYNNSTSDKISLINENIKVTGFDNSKIGKNIIEIEYAGKRDSFEVEIIERQVENIRLKTRPIKTTYIQNYENLDLTGGELEIIYNDNSTDSISLTNSNIQIEGFDNKKIGNNEITVNYAGQQVKFNVEIVSKQIVDIEVIAKPTKVKYVINEENLDLTGGIIAVKYNDESVDKISMTNKSVQIIGFDNTKLGKNTIEIEYVGKKDSFEIEIIEKQVENIKLKTKPVKTTYIQNYEKLDLTGGELTVNYNNGTSDKISLTNENIKVTGFDNSKIGKNIIEIEYAGKKDSFEIEIIEKQIEYIKLKTRPIKTTYIQNYENLDLTGGELEIIYNDNSTDSISLTNSNIQIEGFDNKKIGNNEITVNYIGQQVKFNVEIVSKQIVDIEVIAKPTKMKYVINEENLDLTGGIIAIKYNDESVDRIAMTNESVQTIGFDNTKLGKNKITVQYEGKSVEYEIEIINKTNTIEENPNHNSNNNQSENLKENVDNTISKTELPKAGKTKVMVTFTISLCLFLIFLLKKLRKYNDIKE